MSFEPYYSRNVKNSVRLIEGSVRRRCPPSETCTAFPYYFEPLSQKEKRVNRVFATRAQIRHRIGPREESIRCRIRSEMKAQTIRACSGWLGRGGRGPVNHRGGRPRPGAPRGSNFRIDPRRLQDISRVYPLRTFNCSARILYLANNNFGTIIRRLYGGEGLFGPRAASLLCLGGRGGDGGMKGGADRVSGAGPSVLSFVPWRGAAAVGPPGKQGVSLVQCKSNFKIINKV